MMMPRSMILKVGLFDPLFFLYGEDDDLCERASYHGYSILLVADSLVNHWHTSIRRGSMPSRFVQLQMRNQYIGVLKNHNRPLSRNLSMFATSEFLRLSRKSGSLKDPRFLLRVLATQAEIAWLLPRILSNRLLERRGAVHL